jgi:hypothetical protein
MLTMHSLDTHTLSALPLGSFHSALGGEVTGAGAGPRGHCRLAACPGDWILRSRIRIRSRILGSNHFAFPSLAASHLVRGADEYVYELALPSLEPRGIAAGSR